jgi:lysophospholipase L1-like esterase
MRVNASRRVTRITRRNRGTAHVGWLLRRRGLVGGGHTGIRLRAVWILSIITPLLILGPLPAEAGTGKKFSLTPASGPVGTVVRAASDAPCAQSPDGEAVKVRLTLTDPSGKTKEYTAGADSSTGNWSIPQVVIRAADTGAGVPGYNQRGIYRIDVSCWFTDLGDGQQVSLTTYDSVQFDATTALTFDYQPASQKPGESVVATQISPCPQPASVAVANLYYFDNTGYREVARSSTSVDDSGNWASMSVVVPSTSQSALNFDVTCYLSGGPTFFYDPRVVTVNRDDPPSTDEPAAKYVALGDSYSSGEGNAGYALGTDEPGNRCHRSSLAYPTLLSLGSSKATRKNPVSSKLADLKFAACSGATTADLFGANPHNSDEPKQLSWLGSNTKVVTLTIGGNDLDFAGTLTKCVWTDNPIARLKIEGRPGCSNRPDVTTPLSNRMKALLRDDAASVKAPDGRSIFTISQVISEIRKAAPNARIYIAGYPFLFGNFGPKATATCHVGDVAGRLFGSSVPASLFVRYDDAVWIESQTAVLNAGIKRQVNAAKDRGIPVEFVNVASDMTGHGVCDKEASWINGVTVKPENLSELAPDTFHPNQLGQRSYADSMINAGTLR